MADGPLLERWKQALEEWYHLLDILERNCTKCHVHYYYYNYTEFPCHGGPGVLTLLAHLLLPSTINKNDKNNKYLLCTYSSPTFLAAENDPLHPSLLSNRQQSNGAVGSPQSHDHDRPLFLLLPAPPPLPLPIPIRDPPSVAALQERWRREEGATEIPTLPPPTPTPRRLLLLSFPQSYLHLQTRSPTTHLLYRNVSGKLRAVPTTVVVS